VAPQTSTLVTDNPYQSPREVAESLTDTPTGEDWIMPLSCAVLYLGTSLLGIVVLPCGLTGSARLIVALLPLIVAFATFFPARRWVWTFSIWLLGALVQAALLASAFIR